MTQDFPGLAGLGIRPLLAVHLEYVEPVHPGYGGLMIHADYTHSILGALLLAAILGLAFLPRWGRRVAAVIAFVVMSHWVLDLIVHRPDMPILPGNAGDLYGALTGDGPVWAHG